MSQKVKLFIDRRIGSTYEERTIVELHVSPRTFKTGHYLFKSGDLKNVSYEYVGSLGIILVKGYVTLSHIKQEHHARLSDMTYFVTIAVPMDNVNQPVVKQVSIPGYYKLPSDDVNAGLQQDLKQQLSSKKGLLLSSEVLLNT